jgi:hypothetical protein
MGVAVEDGLGAVRPDRPREPSRAEERPDAFGLTDQRVRDGRVVEEHEPTLAPGDRLEAGLEGLDLTRRLRVDLAEEALSEVCDLGARKPAYEALRPDHADLQVGRLENDVPALEHPHAGVLERRRDLVRMRAVVVVVAQHRKHGLTNEPACVRERSGLLGEAMRRKVARQEHEIRFVAERAECAHEVLASLLGGVNVSDRGNREAGHGSCVPTADSAHPQRGTSARMGTQPNDAFLELVETMKRSAATLRDAKVPFLLGGGLAAWARGGPPTDHDVDFLVRERDVERAQEALAAAGFRIEQPPEGWLVKAWDGDVLVDLIFRPSGGAVGDDHFERATVLEVAAQSLPVASIEDVLAAKLLALTEQEPDYGQVLEIARSLREQIDWDTVRSQVDRTPFGAAFFTLVERLGIVQDPVGSAS